MDGHGGVSIIPVLEGRDGRILRKEIRNNQQEKLQKQYKYMKNYITHIPIVNESLKKLRRNLKLPRIKGDGTAQSFSDDQEFSNMKFIPLGIHIEKSNR